MSQLQPLHGALARPGQRSATPAVAAIVIGLTAFRLWAASSVPLVPDEAYYWLWSRYPSAGYFDHPPMIAWWIWLSTEIFGNTTLGVRASAVFSGLLLSWTVYRTALELSLGRRTAAMAALWTNATFLIAGETIIATPDASSILFWALSVWALARLRRTGTPTLWLWVGLFAGLGCVSKYTNLFLGLGIVLWVAADPTIRRHLRSPWPFLGGAIALAAFLPVIAWNAAHDWVSFAKQFGRITDGHATYRYVFEFIGAQFGLLNPMIAIVVGVGVSRFCMRKDLNDEGAVRFLMILSLPLLTYMAFHSIHDRVQGNWPSPIYSTMALIGVATVRGDTSIRTLRFANWAAPVGIFLQILGIGVIAATGGGIGFKTPIDQVAGWPEFVAAVVAEKDDVGAGWIATANYGLTGELAFYSGCPTEVQEVIDRERYSYDRVDERLLTSTAILVLGHKDRKIDDLRSCFANIRSLGTIDRASANRSIESYSIYLVSNVSQAIFKKGCS